MSDNEIIKALECCSTASDCDECPFLGRVEDCEIELPEYALDLINRQKAELERLQNENNQFADIGKMHSEIKSEAIKKFADRLKTIFNFGVRVYDGMCTVNGVVHNIDNLVKEMTEENK